MASYQQTEQLSTPPILWHQDNHFVFFKVDIQNVKDELITINENKFSFKTSQYFIEFDLFEEINTGESSNVTTEKFVKVSLAKKESIKWPSLTKNRALHKNNIKIDWNAWCDSDAEDNEDLPKSQNDFSNMDFASMMQGMQGMQGGDSMMQQMQKMQQMQGGDETDDGTEGENSMDEMLKQLQGMSEEELAELRNSVSCQDDECEDDECEDYSDMPELIDNVEEDAKDATDYSDMPELVDNNA